MFLGKLYIGITMSMYSALAMSVLLIFKMQLGAF